MQLFHYKAQKGNVGDDLNAILWPKVFGPEFFDANASIRFIGIGSVLDNRHPKPPAGQRHTVFGAGIRSARTTPSDYSPFDIKFVRGPLSAKVIQRDVKYISDPAIISPRFLQTAEACTKKGRIGFVPYFQTSYSIQEKLTKEFDLHLISTSLSPPDFIAELQTCEVVICEAMHGAILADAYRIPWRAVRLTSGVLEGRTSLFKWQDWIKSLSIEGEFFDAVPHLFLYGPRKLRRLADSYAVSKASGVIERALKQQGTWMLSDDLTLHNAQERILSEADALKHKTP